MKLLDRIFSEPELVAQPPVLVDVGAAGGVTPVWRTIARYAVGVGFEPDARDAGKLTEANRAYRRWEYCAGLVAPSVEGGSEKKFYLTKSPHCSSLLPPRHDRLQDWAFAGLFEVQKIGTVPAVTLHGGLSGLGLTGIDWLKCDTQGLDLSIFLSLPETWRRRVLAVEFEPGLIDAYEGEDKFWRTLQAMDTEPFWLCDLEVCKTPRGNPPALREELGGWVDKWLSRLAPGAPGWVNARYLRSPGGVGGELDRRGLLLAWVFADLLDQPAHALMVAREGRARYGGGLFDELARVSRRRLRLAMLRKLPRWLWHRAGLPG